MTDPRAALAAMTRDAFFEARNAHRTMYQASDDAADRILKAGWTPPTTDARRTIDGPHCGTWPWPNSDADISAAEDNAAVHVARGCCSGRYATTVATAPAPPYRTSPDTDALNEHRALIARLSHERDTLARDRDAVQAELDGLRFRVEVACEGYAALMASDVPEGRDLSDYIEGAHDAATGIRAALGPPMTEPS